jgi:hypothetical protein
MAIAGMKNVPLRGFLFPRFRGSSLRSERHEGREAGGSYRGRRAFKRWSEDSFAADFFQDFNVILVRFDGHCRYG